MMADACQPEHAAPSCGAIFVATGEKYVRAGIKAALRINHYSPGLPVHLFTDEAGRALVGGLDNNPFSSVEVLANPNPRSKVEALGLTPFDRTIYFDTDTAVVADIREMFDVLDRNDIAMAHAMHRQAGNLIPYRVSLPDAFPELNSGVLLYKRSPAMDRMLATFKQEFYGDFVSVGAQHGHEKHDQTPLRELVWLSDLRLVVLPPEYNIRYIRYPFFWGRDEAVPRIYHLKQLHMGWWPWLSKTIDKWPVRKQLRIKWKAFKKKVLKIG